MGTFHILCSSLYYHDKNSKSASSTHNIGVNNALDDDDPDKATTAMEALKFLKLSDDEELLIGTCCSLP